MAAPNIQRELGRIGEALDNLVKGQAELLKMMGEHIHEDRQEFRELWKAVGAARTKLAYFAGGIAALTGALEYLIHR
jgi:hypothetical protein